MAKLAKTLVMATLLASSGFTFASAEACHDITSNPPGHRQYESKNGWEIFEGSLFQDLYDLSRKLGMKGLEPKLGHDVYLPKRLFSNGKKPQDVANAVNNDIYGAKVVVKDNMFWILPKSGEALEKSSSMNGCASFTFEVRKTTTIENLRRFATFTGWQIETSKLSVWDKARLMKARVITGTSYYDILGQLLMDTDMEIQINEH